MNQAPTSFSHLHSGSRPEATAALPIRPLSLESHSRPLAGDNESIEPNFGPFSPWWFWRIAVWQPH